MTDISQNAQVSSDWFNYFFSTTMLSMIVLDVIIALVIIAAHRWFVLNERKLNATSIISNAVPAPEKPEPLLTSIVIQPAALA